MMKRICQMRGCFKIIASTKMTSSKKLSFRKKHLWPVQNHIPQKSPCCFRVCFEWFTGWLLMLLCETMKSPRSFSSKSCTKHTAFCNTTWIREVQWCSGWCTLKIHPVRFHINVASLKGPNRWYRLQSCQNYGVTEVSCGAQSFEVPG